MYSFISAFLINVYFQSKVPKKIFVFSFLIVFSIYVLKFRIGLLGEPTKEILLFFVNIRDVSYDNMVTILRYTDDPICYLFKNIYIRESKVQASDFKWMEYKLGYVENIILMQN